MRHPIGTSIVLGLGWAFPSADARPELQNANHIFNAIHSSMRQWGSSLNHNGMSFFIATVPRGTQLYHGTHAAEPIKGTEWLAFEPEHAYMFAHCRRGHPPGKDLNGPPPSGDNADDDGDDRRSSQQLNPHSAPPQRHHYEPKEWLKARYARLEHPESQIAGQSQRARPWSEQKPLDSGGHHNLVDDEECHGYLHTYRSKHDLRLLYIDGQSAAKSTKGTLDTQDIVLLHNNPPPKVDDHPPPKGKMQDGKRRPGGPMSESYRAEQLCHMAEKDWRGRIDGFLRMELGFEIILCNFDRDLEIDHISQVQGNAERGGRPGRDDPGESLWSYKAIASRFDGIGGGRVHIDYNSFVTLFAAQDAVYFDDQNLPRARNDSESLKPVHRAVEEMVLRAPEKRPFDWQASADMIVARYADRIEYLASGDIQDVKSFRAEIDRALRPFIDYSQRNDTAETQRCAIQHVPELPPSKRDGLAATVIGNVSFALCSKLAEAAQKDVYTDALQTIRDLKTWLGWTTWKRCRGCGYNEVCFIPIWPMGGVEDFQNPKCISNLSETSHGYWGGFGGRPSE